MTRMLAVAAALAVLGCGGSATDPEPATPDWKTCAKWGAMVPNPTLSVGGASIVEARCADAGSALVCRWAERCVPGTAFCYLDPGQAPVKCWTM